MLLVLRDTTSVPTLTEDQDAESVLRYSHGLMAIELLDVSRMRSPNVHVSHVDAGATDVLRSPILSRSSPYEPNDGLVPGATDPATIGTGQRTKPRREDRTYPRTKGGPRPPNPSAVLMNPNRSDRTNWPRRNNGGRPKDRRYGNRNTHFGRSEGTYVTTAPEDERETNRNHGYHEKTRRERSNRDEASGPEWTRHKGDSSGSENE